MMKAPLQHYVSYSRDGRELFLFPDRPFWFLAHPDVGRALAGIRDRLSKKEITRNLRQYRSPQEADELYDLLRKTLEDASLFDPPESSNAELTSQRQAAAKDHLAVPVLNLTRDCNLSCRHCYADARVARNGLQSSDNLSTTQWKHIISRLAPLLEKLDEDRLLITGGEPFLRSDLMEILAFVHDSGFRPFVNTNALLIEDSFIQDLARFRTELLVSLDGASEDVHEFLRGPGTFHPTLSRIRAVVDAGVTTKLSFTVHRGNLEEVEAFIELARSLGVAQIAINVISVLHRAHKARLQRPSLIEINEKLVSVFTNRPGCRHLVLDTELPKMGGLLKSNYKFIYCGVGATSLTIDYNGDIYPCYNTMVPEFRVGNVLDSDLLDLWKNSPILNHLRALSVDTMNETCSKCAVRYYCGGGCRGETYFELHDINAVYPFCHDTRESIIDVMFKVATIPDLFSSRIKYYQALRSRSMSHKE